MTKGEWIVQLVANYFSSVCLLSTQLCMEFNQTDLLVGRRNRAIPSSGVTASGLEFRFHGIGCWISNGEISVDFDFMPDGQVGGFDAWRLHVFSDENPSVVGRRSQDEITTALVRLEDQGLIRVVEGSSPYKRFIKNS